MENIKKVKHPSISVLYSAALPSWAPLSDALFIDPHGTAGSTLKSNMSKNEKTQEEDLLGLGFEIQYFYYIKINPGKP